MPIVNNNHNMIASAIVAIHFRLDVDKEDYASLLDAIIQDVVVRYGVVIDREIVAATIAPYYASWKSTRLDTYHLALLSTKSDNKELVMETKKSLLSYIIDNMK